MATILRLENDTIGSQARSAVGNAGALQIRPIRDDCELDEIHRLVHDAYLDAGLIRPQPGGRLIYYPHLDGIPETTVLVAELNGVIVGTSTLTCMIDADRRSKFDWLAIIDPTSGWMILATPKGVLVQ